MAEDPGEEHDGFPEPEEDEDPPAENLAFTQEEFDQLVSDLLDTLVSEDMTPMEQARAVFDYVHANIRYTGTSDKSDWMNGAYMGMTTGKGDCFTYYAVSRALLTALEIDNLEVQRIPGTKSSHYWNLVNCGDGWYHFDACPRSLKMPSFLSFMVTDQQVADFTAMAGRNYYDFDDTGLPERATEIVTKTRPIPRPVEEEGDPEAGDPNAAGPDEPILPPDEQTGEAGTTTEPPAEWTDPAEDPNAPPSPVPGTDPGQDPAVSGGEEPNDVWTEPPVEEWPEPALDGGGDAGNDDMSGGGETEAA